VAPVDFDIGGGQSLVLLPEGIYDVRVIGARRLDHRSGSTSVQLTLEDEDGNTVDLDTLLVNSPGGQSRMIDGNRQRLLDLADVEDGKKMSFSAVLDRLNTGTIRAEVSLIVGKDLNDSPVNKLIGVDAIITDEED
jgi:hypothetical protein